MTSRAYHLCLLLMPWALLIILWHALATSGWVNEGLMPTPGAVASKLVELLFTGRLIVDILM